VERANGILVLEALAFRFHRSLDGLCCPSYDTLIAATGLCRQSIATALKRLEAAGILKITRRLIREVVGGGGFEMTVCRQGSNLYALFAPSEATDKLPCCAPMVRPFPAARFAGLAKLLGWRGPSLPSRDNPPRKVLERGFQGRSALEMPIGATTRGLPEHYMEQVEHAR